MTLDQVVVFHEIVRLGSFKAAAAQLNKTQPAISFSIKKLEEEMNAPLFDRSGYRPILTSHGKVFYEKSSRLIQGMDELEGLTQSFKNKEEPEISVTVDGISPLPKLLCLFKRFGARYPNTKLNLGFDILTESERKVLAREAQFAVTHFISETSLLEVVPISHVTMVPVMNTELFQEKNIQSESDLMEVDQIVVADKNKNSAISFGLLNQGKKWRLNDANFKREIILSGLGWGHLPQHTIERELAEGKLTILKFDSIHPKELEVRLIRLKKASMGLVAKALWDELTSWQA